jgi:hypothetical protein
MISELPQGKYPGAGYCAPAATPVLPARAFFASLMPDWMCVHPPIGNVSWV